MIISLASWVGDTTSILTQNLLIPILTDQGRHKSFKPAKAFGSVGSTKNSCLDHRSNSRLCNKCLIFGWGPFCWSGCSSTLEVLLSTIYWNGFGPVKTEIAISKGLVHQQFQGTDFGFNGRLDFLFVHLSNGTLKWKFERLNFPTKYVIPNGLKSSHWPRKTHLSGWETPPVDLRASGNQSFEQIVTGLTRWAPENQYNWGEITPIRKVMTLVTHLKGHF